MLRIYHFLMFIDVSREEAQGSKEDGFDYTVDLVKLIRSEFGDNFTVGVVGKLEGQLVTLCTDC